MEDYYLLYKWKHVLCMK